MERLVEPSGSAPGGPDPLSDEGVVARVRRGEVDLFEILMRRHNQRLYRIAWAVLRNDDEAEDTVQEAWVRAFECLDQFAGHSHFSNWLTRIALYEAWARARRRRRLAPIETSRRSEARIRSDAASPASDPERRAAQRETASALEAAIEKLPGLYQTVFLLREIEELSTSETAGFLMVSEQVVKTRLHRARALLRRELGLFEVSRAGVFPFLGQRCDRIVERVLARIRRSSSDPGAGRERLGNRSPAAAVFPHRRRAG